MSSLFDYQDDRYVEVYAKWGEFYDAIEDGDTSKTTPNVIKAILAETYAILRESYDEDGGLILSKDLTKFMFDVGSCMGAFNHWFDENNDFIGPSEMQPYSFIVGLFFYNFGEEMWRFDEDDNLILRVDEGVEFAFDPTTFDLPDGFADLFD